MTRTDILLLGATGFTGRLISEYLSSHPDRLAHNVSLTLGGRSLTKLTELLNSLPDKSNISVLHFPSLSPDSDLSSTLNLANTSLVINTVGPYFTYTPTLPHICALTSTHYLDLSGEPHQTFSLIHKFNTHSTALSTRALIIPSCGYDSIPSDLSTYLSAKALFDRGIQPASSTTVHSMRGGLSGGTLATALSTFLIPRNLLELSTTPFALSPIIGPQPHPELRFIYKLVVPGLRTYTGSYFPMSKPNSAVVQRSFGLLELDSHTNPSKSTFHYGSKFTYEEFLQVPNPLVAFLYSSTIFTLLACLLFKPFHILASFLLPPQGTGPPKESFPKGHFKATNVTFAANSTTTYAKTILKGYGDPGYFLTSIMISECALSILVPSQETDIPKPRINPSLPALAHSGGLLTPSTALGDVLVQRLLKTGKFSVETAVWGEDDESRKDK